MEKKEVWLSTLPTFLQNQIFDSYGVNSIDELGDRVIATIYADELAVGAVELR